MKRSTHVLLVLAMMFFLSGCMGATKTTTQTFDDDGKVIGAVIEEPVDTTPFFESGNLNKFYEYEGSRVDKYNALASEKIGFIKEQGIARQKDLTTPTERALSSIVDTLLVSQIPTSPPPDGIAPPKTMADFADKNLIPIGQLLLQGYGYGLFGDIDRPESDSSISINNSGMGDVFFHSSNNKNPAISVAGESSGTFDFGLSKGGDTITKNDSSQQTLW